MRSLGIESRSVQLSEDIQRAIDEAKESYEEARLRGLRNEELSVEKVTAFSNGLKVSWNASRDDFRLAQYCGSVEKPPQSPPSSSLLGFGLQLLSKDLFVDSESIHGLDAQAELLGRQMALGEARKLREALLHLRKQSSSVRFATVTEALEYLARSGVTPQVIIAPRFGTIPVTADPEVLELDLIPESGVAELHGVPVFRSSAVHGYLVVGDLGRSLRWSEWPYGDEQLVVKVNKLTTKELEDTVDNNPKLLLEVGSREARMRYLATQVKFEAFQRLTVEIEDDSALAFVTIDSDPDDDYDELA